MQPVWSLQVDLATKTATFTTGLNDAAKAARDSFKDIKQGAGEMGDGVAEASARTNYSMTEARHGVMMLGEEFGVHLPRGITTFIASLGPVGAAMEAAFPFLAIILGATLLVEHLTKLHDEANKLTDSQANMGNTIQDVFNKLDDKLLEVGIRADELNGNHLAALKKHLELIDRQEFHALMEEFGTLDKVAEGVLTRLQAHWYELGSGSTGASAALDDFRGKYETLLTLGNKKEAGDLLAGTLASAEKVLALQKQAVDNQGHTGGQQGNYQKYEQAIIQLKQMGVGITEKEVDAQQTLTNALRAQVTVTEKLHAIGSGEKKNDTNAEAQRAGQEKQKAAEKAQKDAATTAKAFEEADKAIIAGWKEVTREANSGLEKQLEWAAKSAKEVEESQKAEVAGYAQVHEMSEKALADKAREAESNRKVAEIGIMSGASSYLISKKQEQVGLQTILQQEQADLVAAHLKEVTEQQSFIARMNEMALHSSGEAQTKALEGAAQAQDKLTRSTLEYKQALAQNQAAIAASDLETKKLDGSWSTFFAESNHEMLSLTATLNGGLQKSIEQVGDGFSKAFSKALVEGKGFGSSMIAMGKQMSEEMIQHLVQWGIQDLITKTGMKFAASQLAGANAVASMAAAPFPLNLGAPAFGATAMGSAMAFAEGGIVPGVEKGDVVPARLTPGEGVIPKGAMENLIHAARHGGTSQGETQNHFHYHNNASIQAFDSDGVSRVLDEHGDQFAEKFHEHVRKGSH